VEWQRPSLRGWAHFTLIARRQAINKEHYSIKSYLHIISHIRHAALQILPHHNKVKCSRLAQGYMYVLQPKRLRLIRFLRVRLYSRRNILVHGRTSTLRYIYPMTAYFCSIFAVTIQTLLSVHCSWPILECFGQLAIVTLLVVNLAVSPSGKLELLAKVWL